jgi:hypothetical protein
MARRAHVGAVGPTKRSERAPEENLASTITPDQWVRSYVVAMIAALLLSRCYNSSL